MYSFVNTTGAASPGIGRRERKKLETRRAISRAALDLALENGLDNLTVEAISEAADVSPRTFFNYFPSKEDALVTDAARIGDELRPLILERPAGESPMQVLRAVFIEHDPFALVHANRERAVARQRLLQEHPTLIARQWAQHSLLERTVSEAFAERYGVDPAEDLRPALLAGVMGSAVRAALRRWAGDGTDSLQHLIDTAFHLLDDGLLTDFSAPAGHTPQEVHG